MPRGEKPRSTAGGAVGFGAVMFSKCDSQKAGYAAQFHRSHRHGRLCVSAIHVFFCQKEKKDMEFDCKSISLKPVI